MRTKLLILIFASVLLMGVVSATDIAYVLKNPSNPNAQFVEVMNELNYSYNLIDDSQISSTDFSRYKMILIGNENLVGVPVDRYPSLIVNPDYYSSWSRSRVAITSNQPLTAINRNSTSRITKGVSLEFQVYTRSGVSTPMYLLSGPKHSGVVKIVTTDDLAQYVIATKTNPREVFFGITESDYWTEDSKKLFRNSIGWLIEGEEVNKAPVLKQNIPTLEWNTGRILQINLNDYFSDPNLDKLIYGVYATSNNRNISLTINDSIVKFSSILGWGGEDWIVFYASDGKLSTASNNVTLRVIAEGYHPNVRLLSPANNSQLTDRNIFFEFSVRDNLANLLKCDLYIDNILTSSKNVVNSTTNNFTNSVGDGEHLWNVECFNGINQAFAPSNFVFDVNAPDAPIIQNIGTKTIIENETLRFIITATDPDGNSINLSASELPNGATFTDNKNGTGLFLWTPNLEQAGSYSVTFEAIDTTRKIDRKTASIIVTDLILPPTFEDADTCSVVDSNIVVTISKPRNGEDFEIGEEIKIRTEIKNNENEDVKLDVKAYLYDLSDDKVIEEDKDNVKVKKGENERVDSTITVPDDVDTDDSFAIYVIAFKKKNEFCNSNFAEVQIDKPDEKVIVKDFEISPEEVRGDEKVSFEVEVENIGKDDLEDIYVEIKNGELGLNLKSSEFDLDEDDKETIELDFVVPQNATEQTYEIIARVVYDGESDEKTGELIILGNRNVAAQSIQSQGEVSTGNIINLGTPINLENRPIVLKKENKVKVSSENIIVKEETTEIKVHLSAEEEKVSERKIEKVSNGGGEMFLLIFTNLGVNAVLILGIIVIVILIAIVGLVKRR
ncbi:MAG: Ig-like domain-containing protein [Candidatus Pacearchaeota archaeon]